MELRKGQKIPLDENFLTFKLERKAASAVDIDTAAFLVGANGKVFGDEDFVFYGNTSHESKSVIHGGDDSIKVDLSKVPSRVEKISLTATIYDAEVRKQNFSQVTNTALKIFGANNSEIAIFKLENFTVETAIVLGEIYRYKGSWKFNATGAGFSGGLAALCNDFGIEVSDKITSPPEPEKISPPKINERRAISSKPAKKIELRKGQKVNLEKRGGSLGEIVINLNWSQPSRQTGFFERIFSKGIDLDLCCLYELTSGEIGAVQALGNRFGNLNKPPYISLDGDDRTGNVATGETIRVNGKFAEKIRRILIYTFIYEGAADWSEARGVVSVKCPCSPELIVRMDDYGSTKRTCAIALLENVGGTFSVEKIIKFFEDSREMDYFFGWGLQWTVGYKD